ncbi:FAD/NAD(P)-binding protein [Azospirillum picis]|uniref:NAD(P)/FAD-binding protein YdhS n=1 Tax=Azospirillum picis TaxID=488438 RepID=A0ABU0MN85_9PROT|nr:FAD/NAD(P)-binding protein [Azospirillum picis]MBP2301121.1 putative NAD(P)/FAD-binding protein YdhS [Azospirillum picis]MDQ0534917.1 putative NAD(P)/FAD-binding protein YdhS [Azospirillum picis]
MPATPNVTSPTFSPAERHVVVVGAGFTGSLLTAHLLRNTAVPLTVHLIECDHRPGAGLAYSTPSGGHLLNVRAYNMSAYPDDPRHFLRWLWSRDGDGRTPPSGHAFVSRALYGTYVQDVLAEAQAEAPERARLHLIRGEVVDVRPNGPATAARSFDVRLADGRAITGDMVALCIGNFPPSPPSLGSAGAAEALASDRFIGVPWDFDAISRIDRDAPVAILGTGLTMVDTVLSLLEQGHRGPVTALSRRGLLPQRHEETRPYTTFLHPEVMPHTVLDVLIALKADARRAVGDGYDWRAAFDALRPHHHRIWKHLPMEERRRFLRHARPFWEVHRHRMAPEVADRIDDARESGRLEILAGRLNDLSLTGDGLELRIAPRGGAGTVSRSVGALINATGTNCDYGRIRHPLVRSLLDRGIARPDALRLGLDVTEDGAVIGSDGIPAPSLLALGPVSKAPFWEMTAVPELRSQCAATASRILAVLSHGTGAADGLAMAAVDHRQAATPHA